DRAVVADGWEEEVPAEDDHGQPDGDDPDERGRGQDRLEVAPRQEAGRGRRAVDRHRGEHRDPDRERRVGEPERVPFEPETAAGGAHEAAPLRVLWLVVMSARIAEADASFRGTIETMRPAKIVTTMSERS